MNVLINKELAVFIPDILPVFCKNKALLLGNFSDYQMVYNATQTG